VNVFGIDKDPTEAARALCDRHVVKMCLEHTQVLATFLHLTPSTRGQQTPYRPVKAFMRRGPMRWLQATEGNVVWFLKNTAAILLEAVGAQRLVVVP